MNEYGKTVREKWLLSSKLRSEIKLDEFVIMPNHFHAIVIIWSIGTNTVGANGRSPLRMKPKSLSSLMAGFKSSATSRINGLRNSPGVPVWQRNYYEHIVRNEDELNRIREYIINNPLQWQFDRENPRHIPDKAYDDNWGRLEEEIYGKTKKLLPWNCGISKAAQEADFQLIRRPPPPIPKCQIKPTPITPHIPPLAEVPV